MSRGENLRVRETISRYEIHELLGEGEAGAVYKAWDPVLERCVALRLIPFETTGGEEDRQAIVHRAQSAWILDHPNICPIYEVDERSGGSLLVVSAFCEGETLADRIENGPIRQEGAIELATQVAAAVAHAHQQGLVHGRLRPANIKVGIDGQVKVLDFGLAALDERTREMGPAQKGPPLAEQYLAPEQLAGQIASARSDVWSIGALLAAALSGQPPSPHASQGRLAAGAESWPEELVQVLSRALARNPADRYPQAGELYNHLKRLRRTDSKPLPSLTPVPGSNGGQLSKYRMGERLGGGGMGVVYKAEDVQLGRSVALKFLPPELLSDSAAKSRFLQEARAASALDHPNICTIYEFGETGERQLYLAMPCYDGETLKDRISHGPLPLAEAIDNALQIAQGLAKAHRHGIVHRDIKPANLMITTDRLVKILDFGIAKLAGEAGLTRIGSVLGTPSYMSPEQIRGEEVDARTDLWSLGVVLYEMVTGRRPFSSDPAAAFLLATASTKPEALVHWRPDTPPELERIVEGLLAHRSEDRYPTAEAVAADLRLLIDSLAVSGPMRSATRPQVLPARSPRLPVALAVALLALAGVAGAFFWQERTRTGEGQQEQESFVQLTDLEGAERFPRLSPDGSYFVYNRIDGNDEDIFLQRVGGGNPINLTANSAAHDSQPAYSPDGKWIAFRSERDGGGLFLMGATGESVRRITDAGYQPAWSPDGREIAFATQPVTDPTVRRVKSEIWRLDLATGRQRLVAKGGVVEPSWSPGGQRIVFWGGFGDGAARRALWTVPVQEGAPTPLLEEKFFNWNPAWAPDGRHLYFISDRSGSMNLWRVPIEEASGTLAGEPEPVTIPARFVHGFSLSKDGSRILYATEEGHGSVDRIALTPSGRPAGPLLPVTRIKKKIMSAAPSPDGQWIAMYAQSPQEDLFLMRADGSDLRQLTDDPYHDRLPRWSPDGRLLYFYTDRNGRYEIWTIRPDGSDAQVAVSRDDGEIYGPVPSPDGRRLLYRDFSGSGWIDLAGPPAERVPVPFLPGLKDQSFIARSWSPDMKRLTGTLHARKTMLREAIGVYSAASGKLEKLAVDGAWPTFLADGRTILYLNTDGPILGMDLVTRQTWTVAQPPAGSTFKYFALSFDGSTLYSVRITSEGDLWLRDQK